MEWVSDVSVGAWIADALDGRPWGVPSFVPGGFEAYARVFPPFTRDRAVGHEWGQLEADAERREHHEFDVFEEQISWADTAASFGTTMHPLAQSHRLLRRAYGDDELRADAQGWRYETPAEGALSVELLGRLAAVLAGHTPTTAVFAGIWEGWGGLTSSAGSIRFSLVRGRGPFGHVSAAALRLALRIRSQLRRRDRPGSGLLSKEASVGPRLELPGRDYILFRGGIAAYKTDAWTRTAPWLDRTFAGWVQTPNLMWPADRGWFLATEIDFDTTIIGGSAELISELVDAGGVEAARITLDADLSDTGDTLNT